MGVMNRFMNFLGLQEEEEIVERVRVDDQDEEPDYAATDSRRSKNNVVGLPSVQRAKMFLSEPRSYEETQEIADHLRARRSVVVNLQRVRPELAMRIVDFLSGTVYALSGNISKIGPNIFLCTPESVEVQGSITDILDGEMDYQRTR